MRKTDEKLRSIIQSHLYALYQYLGHKKMIDFIEFYENQENNDELKFTGKETFKILYRDSHLILKDANGKYKFTEIAHILVASIIGMTEDKKTFTFDSKKGMQLYLGEPTIEKL